MPVSKSLATRMLIGSLISFSSWGCQNMNKTQQGAVLGGAGGAGLGAIIGHQFGATGAGAAIGALAGTAGGALAGNSADEADESARKTQQIRHQQHVAAAQQREMTNREVIDMANSGVSDHRIIRTIKNRGGRFDTSPQQIIYLSQCRVSEQVIEAMQATQPAY